MVVFMHFIKKPAVILTLLVAATGFMIWLIWGITEHPEEPSFHNAPTAPAKVAVREEIEPSFIVGVHELPIGEYTVEGEILDQTPKTLENVHHQYVISARDTTGKKWRFSVIDSPRAIQDYLFGFKVTRPGHLLFRTP